MTSCFSKAELPTAAKENILGVDVERAALRRNNPAETIHRGNLNHLRWAANTNQCYAGDAPTHRRMDPSMGCSHCRMDPIAGWIPPDAAGAAVGSSHTLLPPSSLTSQGLLPG